MESNFELPRKRLEDEIESCDVAIKAHREGLGVNIIVKRGFEEELAKLPDEIPEEKEEPCTSTSQSGD